MDAYEVYLNTLRYVMNADPDDKATWSDIFKYLPCLHQMLLCCVCGSLLHRPQGPVNSVCLHYVCHGCVGGKMRLKPSCSWCKDRSHFTENKKLRVLVLCFKRLCAYISNSKLGSEIKKLSANGPGKDPELTRKALEDANKFVDDYCFTQPPLVLPKSMKSSSQKKFSSSFNKSPQPSTSGVHGIIGHKKTNINKQNHVQRRGRKSLSKVPVKSAQSNTSIHVKRLKRKALSSRNSTPNNKKFPLTNLPATRRYIKKNIQNDSSGLLIAQRPHRELSGKFSIGQLWRETFLEEKPPEPDIFYPDSGIEVGNASDQDHGCQPPTLKHHNESEKSSSKIDERMKMIHVRETRLHPSPQSIDKNKLLGNVESCSDENQHKPRLTLKISKKQLSKASRKGHQRGCVLIREPIESSPSTFAAHLPNKISNLNRRELKSSSERSSSRRRDICRCARFKQPNQLTCFGQKCPCYRDKKACIDCLCNGCKNPRRKGESVPSVLDVVNESNCIQHGIDPSMPRLSPIPRM